MTEINWALEQISGLVITLAGIAFAIYLANTLMPIEEDEADPQLNPVVDLASTNDSTKGIAA